MAQYHTCIYKFLRAVNFLDDWILTVLFSRIMCCIIVFEDLIFMDDILFVKTSENYLPGKFV